MTGMQTWGWCIAGGPMSAVFVFILAVSLEVSEGLDKMWIFIWLLWCCGVVAKFLIYG